MATEVQEATHVEQDVSVEKKIEQLRELFADAPEVGKRALENALRELTSQASQTPPPPITSAGRVGARLGKVSELTMVVPLAPGGADRLRPFLKLLGGNLARPGSANSSPISSRARARSRKQTGHGTRCSRW